MMRTLRSARTEPAATPATDARGLTARLGGRWYRRYGTAPCPVCQPEGRRNQNALTLSDGADRLLAHCKKSGCGFQDIMAAAGVVPGAWSTPDPRQAARRAAAERARTVKRATQAKTLWEGSAPIRGTLAEAYLRARGITCSLPPSLRFKSACWHPSAQRLAALVALVEGDGSLAVHRTYLRGDGLGKADVDPAKAMLGQTLGGAVRLTDDPGPLVVAEGIETALSLACGLLPEAGPIWAALSAPGMRNLTLPTDPGALIIACDGDCAGRDAALALAQRATARGWSVRHADPGDGRDFNDLLSCGVEA